MSKKSGVDKETRKAALLVSGLLSTSESGLEVYRDTRLAGGSDIPLDHVARSRAVLLAVAEVLTSTKDEDHRLVEALHRLVTDAPPTSAPPPEATSSDEAADDDEEPIAAPDPVPRPARVGERSEPSAPALAAGHASPWANPTAALASTKPKPPAASTAPKAPEPPSPPAPVAPPPRVEPVPPDDDEEQTVRPASSAPPSGSAAPPSDRFPPSQQTAAPPASTTAEAGFELPSSPALPFREPPGDRPSSSPGRPSGGEWALPFQPSSSAAPPGSSPGCEPAIPPAPARFPRAEPDDDEPTIASINLIPGAIARDGERSSADVDPGPDLGHDDTFPAAIGGAALAHMAVPGSALSLTDYAVLCAVCGAFPGHLSDTYLKFGLSDHAERYALDEAWQAHFSDHPEAHELWRKLFTQFRAWLTQYGSL